MEILVISDSHGNTSNFAKILTRHPKIEFILHLGDYSHDILRMRELRPTAILEAVLGNCDRQKLFPMEQVLPLVGKRIFLTHGHGYGVKSSMVSLVTKGSLEKADIILYGHTHIPKVEMIDGIWVVNPGSITLPKEGNKASYAIVELSKDAVNPRLLNV